MISRTLLYLDIDSGSIHGGCRASLRPRKLEYSLCGNVSLAGDPRGCTLAVPGPFGCTSAGIIEECSGNFNLGCNRESKKVP